MRTKESEKIRKRLYYQSHKEEFKARSKKYAKLHPDAGRKRAKKYLWLHREELRIRQKEATRELKLEVVHKYGGICACCGESNIEFLCIDHINGGGTKHTKLVGRGQNFYKWLRRNKYPGGYRTLCHNCNASLGHYGYCPHNKNGEKP